ncbi:MAG: hypothetical protein AAF541_10910 [Pseudomonadota bacterium]
MKTEDQKVLAELLACRDSEPYEAQVLQELSEAEKHGLLSETCALQDQLNQLPDVPVNHALWQRHVPGSAELAHERSGASERLNPWLRFPMATAASVFFVSVLGVFMLFSTNESSQGDISDFVVSGPNLDSQGVAIAGLMTRSRDLEQRLRGLNGWVSANSTVDTIAENDRLEPSPEERVMLYRLADVDGQIGRLYESDNVDQGQRLELWRKRVDLLENLVVMRSARQGIRSVYMDDGRSM